MKLEFSKLAEGNAAAEVLRVRDIKMMDCGFSFFEALNLKYVIL